MTTDKTIDIDGKSLIQLKFNGMMQYPGSFRVEIRTEPKGKGECLAKQGNCMATSSFNAVVIGFEEQPKLEVGGNVTDSRSVLTMHVLEDTEGVLLRSGSLF